MKPPLVVLTALGLLCLALASCTPEPPEMYPISITGYVSGLVSDQVTLRTTAPTISLDESKTMGNGTVTLGSAISTASGASFTVEVVGAGRSSCLIYSMYGNTGSVSYTGHTSVFSGAYVQVKCTPPSFSVGGTVSGLGSAATDTVTLKLNGSETLTVGNGPFTFPTGVQDGTAYAVTATPQGGATCTVARASGTIATAPVTTVAVTCTPGTPPAPSGPFGVSGTVGGWIQGQGYSMTATLTSPDATGGAETVTVTDANSASFGFTTKLTAGSKYTVTVSDATTTAPGAPTLTCLPTPSGEQTATTDVSVSINCQPGF